MKVTKQLTEAVDCHSMEANTVGVNGFINLLFTNILQNIFFCVLQVWNKSRVGKLGQGLYMYKCVCVCGVCVCCVNYTH